jgi:hypothetical protein
MIPAEPPVLSLQRVLKATGMRAALEADRGQLKAELDEDVLRVRVRGTAPIDGAIERLRKFTYLLVGPSVGCSDDIEVELTVHGIANLLVYEL